MKKNNASMWILGLIVVLIIGVLYVALRAKPAAPVSTGDTTGTTTGVTTGTTPDVVNTAPESVQDVSGVTTGVAAASISYANALVKYANRRIQVDASCRATPSVVTYKDYTGIMIDNRSATTRTFKIGTTFAVKPYGFKIVVLPDVYLKSKTLLVDCDAYQNIATILVQE